MAKRPRIEKDEPFWTPAGLARLEQHDPEELLKEFWEALGNKGSPLPRHDRITLDPEKAEVFYDEEDAVWKARHPYAREQDSIWFRGLTAQTARIAASKAAQEGAYGCEQHPGCKRCFLERELERAQHEAEYGTQLGSLASAVSVEMFGHELLPEPSGGLPKLYRGAGSFVPIEEFEPLPPVRVEPWPYDDRDGGLFAGPTEDDKRRIRERGEEAQDHEEEHEEAEAMNEPAMSPRLTRQGVRNLNGPSMDGRHNARAASCEHYRSPDMGTYTDHEMVLVNGVAQIARVAKCSSCGEIRWTELDDERTEEVRRG